MREGEPNEGRWEHSEPLTKIPPRSGERRYEWRIAEGVAASAKHAAGMRGELVRHAGSRLLPGACVGCML